MERLSKELFEKASLADEHFARYMLAARMAQGHVADCASGIGYGSTILLGQPAVTDYVGVDPSDSALKSAREHHQSARAKFIKGTLEKNAIKSSSIDTFVMMETLEHVIDPEKAVAAVAERLKPEGILIGSVPSKTYEELCEQTYGPNPYHIQRFTPQQLLKVLRAQFARVDIFAAEYVLGTLLQPLDEKSLHKRITAHLAHDANPDNTKQVSGSLFFVAGAEASVAAALDRLGDPARFVEGHAKALIDAEELKPVYDAFHSTERLVAERDAALAGQAETLDQRWQIMTEQVERIDALSAELTVANQQMHSSAEWREDVRRLLSELASEAKSVRETNTSLVDENARLREMASNLEVRVAQLTSDFQALQAFSEERTIALTRQEIMIDERDRSIQSQSSEITARDRTIADQTTLINERDQLIQRLEVLVQERDRTISDQTALVDARDLAIADQQRLIQERDQLIQQLEAFIQERDVTIADQAALVNSRDATIADQTALVDSRDATISAQAQLIDERDAALKAAALETEQLRQSLSDASVLHAQALGDVSALQDDLTRYQAELEQSIESTKLLRQENAKIIEKHDHIESEAYALRVKWSEFEKRRIAQLLKTLKLWPQ